MWCWLTESMRGVSRTGRWGQTRQASLPLGSFLKESGVEGDEDAVVGSKRSSRRRFRCCASRAQLSPPNTLMPASSPSLPRPPGGDLVDWRWFGPRSFPGPDRDLRAAKHYRYLGFSCGGIGVACVGLSVPQWAELMIEWALCWAS